jgi:hypothetical protein
MRYFDTVIQEAVHDYMFYLSAIMPRELGPPSIFASLIPKEMIALSIVP